MVRDTSSIGPTDPICIKPFDSMPISSPSLPTTPSQLHAFHKSLGDLKYYYPSFDPYYTYLKDVSRKIIWSCFFDNAFDFSIVVDKFKGTLTLFDLSLLVFSYSHHSKMHATTYDKGLESFDGI